MPHETLPKKKKTGGVHSAQPDIILAADWSVGPEGRAVWRADVAKRLVGRLPWRGRGFGDLLEQSEVDRAGRRVLIALDAALGLPAAAWLEALALEPQGDQPRAFPDWLARRNVGEIGRKSSQPRAWNPRSPFLTLPKEMKLDPFVEQVGVAMLRRRVDTRAGAKLPFISGLPGFVGAASQSVWCELLSRLVDRNWGFWPFDGRMGPILEGRGAGLAETYPAILYRVVLPDTPTPRKASGGSRAAWLDALAGSDWIRDQAVETRDMVAAEVNENEFDACVMSLALLRLVLEKRALDNLKDDPVSEGGILALDASLEVLVR